MAVRGVIRAPYGAVRALSAWAVEHWHLFDGRCLLAGIDPLALPAFRLANLLHTMIVDGVWDDEKRVELERSLDWPDAAEESLLAEQDRQAREAMRALGIDPDALLASAQPPPQPGGGE